MNRTMLKLGMTLLAAVVTASVAQAQATRTWVSGVGDDVNPCSRTAPCKTFAGAISKTATNGEINCLDSGGFGAVTITKSITIKCEGVIGGILASLVNGVTINDTTQTAIVTLSGLDIEGVGNGLNGINFIAGAALHVHKTQIRGMRGTNGSGILFQPSAGGKELYVADSYITDNGSSATTGGIVFRPGAAGGGNITINRTQIENNSAGIIVDGSVSTLSAISATVTNSVVAGNSNNGITATTAASRAATTVMVFQTQVSFNVGAGINANGPTGSGLGSSIVRVGSSVINNNVNGITAAGLGVVKSYGNNQVNGNSAGEVFSLPNIPLL